MKIIWLGLISCNGNTHSFLNYSQIEQFLNDFEILYHPLLDSKYSLNELNQKEIECDILLLEGAISAELKKGDIHIFNLINKYAKIAKKIITVGTCATFGGIFKQSSYNYTTGFHFDNNKKSFLFKQFIDKTISISGCPIHPEILASVLYSIKYNIDLKLDEFLRPVEFFKTTIHQGCTRNEYFEYKIDNHQFGKKEGCMFYEHGCKATFTLGSCNKILWNEVNSKTRAGTPCFGCVEPDFPQENLFFTKKNMGIPAILPIGVPKRAYLTIAGISKAFKIKRLQEDLF